MVLVAALVEYLPCVGLGVEGGPVAGDAEIYELELIKLYSIDDTVQDMHSPAACGQ